LDTELPPRAALVGPGEFEAFLDRVDVGLSDPAFKIAFDTWLMNVETATGLDSTRLRRLRQDLIKVISATHRLDARESTILVDAWLGAPPSSPRR
jgi:hypothetical protein